MSIFNVERDAVPVGLLGNASTTLTVLSGDILYYADNSQVSASNNQGSLTSGNSATFTNNVWIVSASASSVSQSFTAASGGSPSGGSSGSGGSGASSLFGIEPGSNVLGDALQSAPWSAERFTRGYEIDSLQAHYPRDEQDMIDVGALLWDNATSLGSFTSLQRSALRPGPAGTFRRSIQGFSSGSAGASYPIDGCVAHDNSGFTIEMDIAVDPTQGLDLHDLAGSPQAFQMNSGVSEQMKIAKSGTNLVLTLSNDETLGGIGGSHITATPQLSIIAPIVTTATIAASTAMTAIAGTVQPTVGTLVTGRGIAPGTYVTASAGISGAWTATLSQAALLSLTATNVTFSDMPCATAQQATQTGFTASTHSSTTVDSYTGTTAPVPGMSISGVGIPVGAYITAVSGSSAAYSLTISAAATATATGVAITITDYPILPREQGGFCPNSAVASNWDGVSIGNYPLIPFATLSVVYNPGTFTGTPVSGTLSLIAGNGRRSAAVNISQTANGTVSGTSVSAWAGTSANLAPVAGMLVYGPGVPSNTFIASVSGSTGNYTLTLTNAVTSTGTQAITVASNLMPRPWSSDCLFFGQGKGFSIFGVAGGYSAFWVSPPAFYRYPRTVNQIATELVGPTISADMATAGSAWNTDLTGVVAKYTGDQLTEASETATAVRDQQITWAVNSGLLRRRETEYHGRALPTLTAVIGTGTVAAGSNQITSWTPQAPQTANGNPSSTNVNIAAWAGTNAPPPGSAVSGTGIPGGTVITAVSGSTGNWTLWLSQAPSTGVAVSITVTPPTIAIGMTLAGAGIPWATTVTNVVGSTITLSNSTIAAQTANGTLNTNTTVNSWAGTTAPTIGSQVSGTNIPASTTIAAVTGGSGAYTLTLSQAATGSGSTSLTITPAASAVSLAGGTVTNSYTDLFTRWDRWHTRYGGAAGTAAPTAYRVYGLIGYTPAAFNANTIGSFNTVPNIKGWTDQQTFALQAVYHSQVIQALQARYPTHLDSAGFYNEPSASAGWGVSQFGIAWAAHAAQINADQAALGNAFRLGGVDDGWSAGPSGTNNAAFQQSVIQAAQTWGLALPGVTNHSYDGVLAVLLESMLGLKNNATANGGLTPKLNVSELDYVDYAARETSTDRYSREPFSGPNSVHQAAYLHAATWELARMGVNAIMFFTLGQFQAAGGAYWSCLLTNGQGGTGTPAVTPMGALMQMLWQHSGSQLANVSTNYPGLRCLGSISPVGSSGKSVRTLSYSSYRPYKPYDVRQFYFQWSNLPSTFTWQQWRYDARDRGDGRMVMVGEGNQSNLPRGTDLTHVGIGGIQIIG